MKHLFKALLLRLYLWYYTYQKFPEALVEVYKDKVEFQRWAFFSYLDYKGQQLYCFWLRLRPNEPFEAYHRERLNLYKNDYEELCRRGIL